MPTTKIVNWIENLRKCCRQVEQIHPTDFVLTLYGDEYITEEQYDDFNKRLTSAERRMERDAKEKVLWSILEKLTDLLAFDQFLETLFKLNLYTETLEFHQIVERVIDTSTAFKKSQKLYIGTKMNVQNNIYKDSTCFCENLYNKYKGKLQDSLKQLEKIKIPNAKHHQKDIVGKYASMCVACLFVYLDTEITRWCSNFSWNEDSEIQNYHKLALLFDEVKFLMKHSPNVNIVEVGLYSRVAVAYAMAGDLSLAMKYITKAYTASVFIPICAELHFMQHMFVMILLFLHQESPTNASFNRVSEIAELSLNSLNEEKDMKIQSFWRRMIMLRKVFALVGLKNNMEILRTGTITLANIREGDFYLSEIRKTGNMEARREMFFFTAKARINKLQGKIKVAVECLKKAINFDENNSFGETENVKAYLEELEKELRENIDETALKVVD